MPTMISMTNASEITGVPYSAIRRWIKNGDFKYYVMVGTKYLINLEKLIEFLNTPVDL